MSKERVAVASLIVSASLLVRIVSRSSRLSLLVLLVLSLLTAGCAASDAAPRAPSLPTPGSPTTRGIDAEANGEGFLSSSVDPAELARDVIIFRDRWGVPHVHGRTDEAAVFGLAWARAEDQFEQIEDVFIGRLGRSSELYGEEGLFPPQSVDKGHDLSVHAFGYLEEARDGYENLSPKLRRIVDAYAAGLNFYLEKHPEQPVRLLNRFEPWWVVAVEDFSESYRGRAQSGLSASNAREIAGAGRNAPDRGSNTWAIGPGKTASGNAMLLINPHDPSDWPYYECHISSDEGLNSYGVINYWGALMFPYIGFNEHHGWSVTVNEPDLGDAFEMTFDHPTDPLMYRFGDRYLRAAIRETIVGVRGRDGIAPIALTFRDTIQGPVLATSKEGKPLSFRIARSKSGTFTEQLYRMHKARSFEEWREAVALRGLTYHNLMYADREGNIFYLYNGNVPVRNDLFDWTAPVDGSDPRTLWKGYHEIEELPQLLNPDVGYLQNCNTTPYATTHAENPDPADYPRYMANLEDGTNYRGEHSKQKLRSASAVTLDRLQEMVTDDYIYAADEWLPSLFAEWRASAAVARELHERLREPIAALEAWNRRSGPVSFETTLFALWDEAWWMKDREGAELGLVAALDEAIVILEDEFDTWKVPWEMVFRHQRTSERDAVYWDESKASYPTAGTNGRYGTMFALRGEPYDGERDSVRRRMTHGNSFVSIVELTEAGPVARSIVAYGNSSRPDSPHWDDQAEMFAAGRMKPVLFRMKDILENLEKSYHPGER